MPFKRDGGDLSFLKKMKRQRVSELLGTYIPEDEAKLLSNGRLACSICHHHPAFDTVPLLSKHRKGKVHLLELSRHINKLRKQDFLFEPVKKKHTDPLEGLEDQMSVMSISQTLPGTESTWHKTLDLQMFNQAEPLAFFIEPESSRIQSSASEVSRYLSTLHRKRSLRSLIEWKRKNYEVQATTIQNVALTELQESSIDIEPFQ